MPKTSGPKAYTDHLNRKTAENICHAFDFAKFIGRPLNTSVVINLDERGASCCSAALFERIRHKYRDWLNYRIKQAGKSPLPPHYVYTLENPEEHPHVNWVVHVPPDLLDEFLLKLPKWVEKAQGQVREFDIDVTSVNPHTDKSLAKYIIKGTDPHYVKYLHLDEYAAPQGRVYGRRAAPSMSLGRAARKRAGFVPKLHRNDWKNRTPAPVAVLVPDALKQRRRTAPRPALVQMKMGRSGSPLDRPNVP